jgi:cell division protein FtsZ
MIFIIPLVFGALGAAVGAVAGAFTAHAAGEKDRQAAKHHRQVANELTGKYASLEKKYYEFADESKRQINDLTRQHALDEVEKDCLRLAVRLQQHLIFLMWEIDRESTADAFYRFKAAVEQTNQVLYQLKEELIIVPNDYYARLLTAIADRSDNNQPNLEANKTLALTEEDDNDEAPAQIINIKVIGIGWDGINAVNHMIETNISGVEFWAIDTDIAMLYRRATAPNSLQIGSELNRPLNLSDIGWGEMVANESRDEIAGVLDKTKLVFIVASIGDDTAVGAASIVAEVAKEMGVLTIGVVNRSFFDSQIEPLKSRVDTLIIIPSYRQSEITPEQDSVPKAYYDRFIYDLLRQAVQCISNLITIPGLLNPHFADVCTVMTDRGAASMGIGVSSGKFRARKAAKAAISSPFLEGSIEEAKGVVFNITGGSDLTLNEVNTAVETIYKFVDPKASISFGTTIDDQLKDEVIITVIATGFKYLGLYKKLRDLLADGKWEEADNETAKLILKLSGQRYEMSSEYKKNVPATEFHTIDNLWNKYSNGRFGFSVQKRIWQEEYRKLGEFNSKKNYAQFCDVVGWRVINGCLLSSYLNFSFDAPLGHLPVKVACQGGSAASFLCSVYKSEQEEEETLGIYVNLKKLLLEGKWKEANEETRIIMLKIAGQSQEGFFQEEDIEHFPSHDLETIDRLWCTYSHDHFGFSVQNHIWQNVQEDWHEFGDCVEWGYYDEWDNLQWISKEEIIFNLNAPRGHLPAVFPCVTQFRGFSARLVWSVLSKFQSEFDPKEVDFLKRLEPIGIYQRLRRLLAAGKWREANHETRRVMLKLAGRIKQGDFPKGYICSSQYIYIIDKLWVIYSKGHFGFSVQEDIWQEVDKDFQDFGTRVGWGLKRRKDYFWISHHKLNFSLDAPLGHLPAVFPSLNQYRGFDEQNVCYILSKFEFIPK